MSSSVSSSSSSVSQCTTRLRSAPITTPFANVVRPLEGDGLGLTASFTAERTAWSAPACAATRAPGVLAPRDRSTAIGRTTSLGNLGKFREVCERINAAKAQDGENAGAERAARAELERLQKPLQARYDAETDRVRQRNKFIKDLNRKRAEKIPRTSDLYEVDSSFHLRVNQLHVEFGGEVSLGALYDAVYRERERMERFSKATARSAQPYRRRFGAKTPLEAFDERGERISLDVPELIHAENLPIKESTRFGWMSSSLRARRSEPERPRPTSEGSSSAGEWARPSLWPRLFSCFKLFAADVRD